MAAAPAMVGLLNDILDGADIAWTTRCAPRPGGTLLDAGRLTTAQ
jgi:hypothetical protein